MAILPDLPKLARDLAPYLRSLLTVSSTGTSSTSGGSSGAPSPHDLDSSHHTGTLDPSQAPWALAADGSVTLTGNLGVAVGVTIDGVDLSAHASNADAHHAGFVGLTDDASATASPDASDLIKIEGGSGVDTTTGTNKITVAVDSTVVRTTRQVATSTGLSGGGDLSANRTLSIDQTFSPTWTGSHTFQGSTTTRTVVPEATDSYDLGSSTRLWRKGYLSELEALLFAQNTVSVVGGWLIVGTGSGTLNADLTNVATTVDFGQSMTVGHFILLRAFGQVEYLQVGSLVSGTTYNVTRNLDGSGANTWPAGTVYLILGTTGDGRIELNASSTPRISFITQGATYSAQTEVARIGDLNGGWGYGSAMPGVAIGEYAASRANTTIDQSSGLRLRIHSTTKMQLQPDGDLFIGPDISAASSTVFSIFSNAQTYNSESMGSGDLLIGDNSASKANILWDKSAGQLLFRGGTTTRLYIDTDGSLVFGTAACKLNSDGLRLDIGASAYNHVRWMSGSTVISAIGSRNDGFNDLWQLWAGDPTGSGTLMLQARATSYIDIPVGLNVGVATGAAAGDVRASGAMVASGAITGDSLNIGTTSSAAAGAIRFNNKIEVYKNSTYYETYQWVFLETPLTSTTWDGDAKSDVGSSTSLDMQTVFGVPENVKAVYLQIVTQDSAAAGTDGLYFACGPSSTYWYALASRPTGGDVDVEASGIVKVDSSGRVWYRINASGASTLDVWIWCWGYAF